ncbi:Thioredoxin reductase (chromatophore) [Paulinella micropora]|uniref:Thioredoxin reductase n=1 Tax=Paulinella micropora TaxID=1928728 RepID=A0A1S6YH15_9EUKA|nr:Thioredoxin reductase [Paulinella micropora]BBL86679.1 Thioredoxin reductase [Paulinella micropora]
MGFDTQNLIIIGSGPAGYTASIYAARANISPLLITGFSEGGIPGGQLMTTTDVENFPGFPRGILGPELMTLMKEQATRWGTRFLEADVTGINLSVYPYRLYTSEGQEICTKSIIIATGASANRLNLPNENTFWSKGISACAICDGATPQFRNQRLVVVGGGDSACEEAVYLTKYGSKIDLIVRSDKLKASATMIHRVMSSPDITIYWNTKVIDVSGDQWLQKVKIKDNKNGNKNELNCSGLFYAIGHTPNTRFLQGQLATDIKGYLITQQGRPETSLEGVFAAGDVTDAEWRQGITAAGSGCQAALAAERWLSHYDLSVPIEIPQTDEQETTNLTTNSIDENTYDPEAQWQKGSISLRKLYHESNRPLLVVYTSPTCGPCHILKPQLKRVLSELDGKAQGVEIDIESDQEIALQAGINGTPTVQLFYKKELKQEWRGIKKRGEFKAAIESLL